MNHTLGKWIVHQVNGSYIKEMDCTSRKWVLPLGKWNVGNVSYYLREIGKSIITDGKELGQQSKSQAHYPLSTSDYPCEVSLIVLQVLNAFSRSSFFNSTKKFHPDTMPRDNDLVKKTSEVLRRALSELETSAAEQSCDERLDRQLQGNPDRQSQRSATVEFRQVHNI